MPDQPPVILLMGPTAVGKTAIAMELAERASMEIISVDSALVYRGMDIGTAKPDIAMQKRVPHHLIDICEVTESYSVARFIADTRRLIQDILSRGHTPLLCGGTMLYYRVITRGLSRLPAADEAIRRGLLQEAAQKGWAVLHQELAQIDAQAAARIHPNDSQRIGRALEVYRVTGISLTAWRQQNRPQSLPYNFFKYAVFPEDRAVLHQRIERRFDDMLSRGFVEEVEGFYRRSDVDLTRPSMRCVGYRQIWRYLEGGCTYEEMRLRGIYATRQLAKRQLTWLRGISDLRIFDVEASSSKARLMDEICFQT